MKGKTAAPSVKWKLFLYFFIFAAVLIALLWIAQTVLLEKIYRAQMTSTIKAQSSVIAENIDNDQLDSLMESVSQNHNLSAQLIDKDGNVIYTAMSSPGSGLEKASPNEKKYWALAAKNGGQYIKEGMTDGPTDTSGGAIAYNDQNFTGTVPKPEQLKRSNITCATLITRSDGSQVLLLVTAFLQPLGSTVSTLRFILITVSIVMALLSLLLALILAHRISSPLTALSNSAMELADGNYDVHFELGGYSEVNRLSDALNYAAGELSKLENLRREFIANVSHDLRTPLTMITGYGEMMRDIPGENTPENVQIIIDEANRLSGMVTDILDLSKLQSGATEPQLAEFDLTSGLQSLAARFKKLSGRENVAFEHESDVVLTADEGMVTRAAYNLLCNANAHTPPDGSITISQTAENGMVKITVTDTGEGIREEELDHIWERYAKGTNGEKTGGAGLGLAIVRAIVLAHHGTYGVESKYGEGSSFWFCLPEKPALPA